MYELSKAAQSKQLIVVGKRRRVVHLEEMKQVRTSSQAVDNDDMTTTAKLRTYCWEHMACLAGTTKAAAKQFSSLSHVFIFSYFQNDVTSIISVNGHLQKKSSVGLLWVIESFWPVGKNAFAWLWNLRRPLYHGGSQLMQIKYYPCWVTSEEPATFNKVW